MRSRKITLWSLLLALAPAASGAQMPVAADTGRSVVTTNGQARATVGPDRATVAIFIEPQAMSVDEASSREAAVERAVTDTLRRMGLSGASMQVVNSGVAPYRDRMNPMAGGASYSGRSAIRVETSRLDLIPAITGAALAKGAANVSAPVFTVSASDSVRRALLPQAFQQARREAEVLAAAAGGRLGRLVSTSSTQPVDFADRMQSVAMASMIYDSGQRAVPNNTVLVTVTTSWALVR